MKLRCIAILLLTLFCACSQKTLKLSYKELKLSYKKPDSLNKPLTPSNRAISSRQRQRYSMALAKKLNYKLLIDDSESFFSLVVDDIRKTNPNIKVDSNLFDYMKKYDYKIEPISVYTIDWNNFNIEEEKNYTEQILVNDTLHTSFISLKGNKVLGITDGKKLENQWHVGRIDQNYNLSMVNDNSRQDYSPFIKGIKEAYKYSDNVFYIAITKPPNTFLRYSIGYIYKKKVRIIEFFYGEMKYEDVNSWLAADHARYIKNKGTLY